MDTQSLMTKYPCESYTFHEPRKNSPKKHPRHPTLTTLPGWLSIKNWLQKMFQKKVAICKNPQLPKRVDLFFVANCFHMFPSRLPDICETVKDCNLYLGGGNGGAKSLNLRKIGIDFFGFISRVIWVTQTWILRWISQICNIHVHFIVGATLKPRDAFFVSVLKILFQDLTICKLADYLMPVEINTLWTTLFVRILFTWCFNHAA